MSSSKEETVASPYTQKEEDRTGTRLTPTVKSYRNTEFLSGGAGRLVRILCEFEEPKERLRRHFIRSTFLFFGSARSMQQSQYDATVAKLEEKLAATAEASEKKTIEAELARLEKTKWMCKWVDVVEQLAKMVAEFAKSNQSLLNHSYRYIPDYFKLTPEDHAQSLQDLEEHFDDLVVTTGGGPGFMEAANRGAASVPGAKTMGMGVSLPFEKGLNAHVTNGLAFEFHYFFTRKFWMMYSCRAIVVAPGGFGTLDEMFELLTLQQTHKIPPFPVILIGKEFWQTIINWQALADFGVVSQAEIDRMLITDSPEEAIDYLKKFYTNLANSQTQ